MPVRIELNEGRVPVKVFTDDVEFSARRQLVNLSQLPIIHHHVAAMPDVHAGIGATVGTVIATDGAVIRASEGHLVIEANPKERPSSRQRAGTFRLSSSPRRR